MDLLLKISAGGESVRKSTVVRLTFRQCEVINQETIYKDDVDHGWVPDFMGESMAHMAALETRGEVEGAFETVYYQLMERSYQLTKEVLQHDKT